MRAAVSSGDVSREAMLELIIHFAHYGGWPLSTSLYSAFQKTAAELDAKKA
jgi:alkylhydroperoxidase/carboxymuconolactone decarboxylase family protein YurZ